MSGEDSTQKTAFGDWELDLDAQVLRRGEENHRLDPKDFGVLTHLIEASPGIVTTEELLDRTWAGSVVGDNALQQVIARLRKTLGDDARSPTYIETVPRRGYRVMADLGSRLPEAKKGASNLGLGVAAFLLLVCVVIAGWWHWGSELNQRSDAPTRIVLLPFERLGSNSDFNLAEDVTIAVDAQLGRLQGVEMIARRSADIASASGQDIQEIAAALRVAYVVEGSVNRRGDQVRVLVSLIDGQSGVKVDDVEVNAQLTDTQDYFSLYDEVAGRVAGGFPFEFQSGVPETTASLIPSKTAYEKVQRAYYGPDEFEVRFRLIEEALATDPRYARAYSVRANFTAAQAELRMINPKEGFERARQDAARALSLDPGDTLALGLQGAFLDRLDLNFPKALQAFEHAIEMGAPADEVAWYQDTLLNAGLFDRGRSFTSRMERDDPLIGEPKVFSARFLYHLGDTKAARAKMEEALVIDASSAMVVGNAFSFFLDWLKDIERAEQLVEEVRTTEATLRSWRARIAVARGNPEPLREYLAWYQHEFSGYVDPSFLADGYYRLGDYSQYMSWTRKRVAQRVVVGWLAGTMRLNPDYWNILETWAGADSDRQNEVREFKAFIETTMQNLRVSESRATG